MLILPWIREIDMQRVLTGLVALLLAASTGSAAAQVFPQRAVRIVVPFTPGGGPDVAARVMGKYLSDMWAQPVLVENRAGGRTLIGTELVVRSAPDGYTLLMITNEVLVSTGLGGSAAISLQKDLAPVILIQTGVNVLAVRPDSPIRTVKDLLAQAQASPGKLTFGTPGVGSSSHMAAEQLMLMTKISLQHIPYKGTAQSISDAAGGQISMVLAAIPPLTPMFQSGKLRPVAVGSIRRFPALPDVPTLDESGLTGFDMSTVNGLMAPAATPAAIIAKINRDAASILSKKEVVDNMLVSGSLAAGGTPADMATFLQERVIVLKKLIAFANITFD